MDLINYKRIKNGALPKFHNGEIPDPSDEQPSTTGSGSRFLSNIGKALGGAASWIGKGIGKAATTAWNNIKKNPGEVGSGLLGMASQYIDGTKPAASASDFFNNAKITQGNLGGYMYDILGDGGESAAMDLVSANTTSNMLSMGATGATTGAAVGGPWGAAVGGAVGIVGGLFSGNSAKKAQEEQIRIGYTKKDNKTRYGYDWAKTNALADQYRQEYGDLDKQQLIGLAANGKRPVWSPYGLVDAKATAWVSNGEVIGNLKDGYAVRVPGRKNNKDTKLAALSDGDFVLSNKYGISDYAALSGDYIGALNLQEMLLGGMRNAHGYKNGKLPGFELGAILPSIFNASVGLSLMAKSTQEPSSPYSYVSNKYEGLLPKLLYERVNTLPIYNNNREAEAKSRNAIVRSGGLGAGQLASALQTGAYNRMLANANELMNAQLLNSQLRTNAIKAVYEGGAHDAAGKTAAGQWDYDRYMGAHNNAQLMGQTGLYNIAKAMREGYKNQWDKYQFDRAMDNYEQKLKIDQMGILGFLKSMGLYKSPTQDQSPMTMSEYLEKNPPIFKPSLDFTNPTIQQWFANEYAPFNPSRFATKRLGRKK